VTSLKHIAALERARDCSLSRCIWIQSMHSILTSSGSVFFLSSYLHLSLQTGAVSLPTSVKMIWFIHALAAPPWFGHVINLSIVIISIILVLLLTYLFTELSPSWEAANCAATQELPSILKNPKVHHRVHKSPPLVHIFSQIDLVHTIQSHLSKIHFNIVHPPTSWSS
jgi:hypothetical protein